MFADNFAERLWLVRLLGCAVTTRCSRRARYGGGQAYTNEQGSSFESNGL